LVRQEQPGEGFPKPRPSPAAVVLLELSRAAKQATGLYLSDDWEVVLGSLSEESRTEAAHALRSAAFIAQSMAEDLEKKNGTDEAPPTNYGIQR
jgi:hypothetical protein